jgi:hypothetical protein
MPRARCPAGAVSATIRPLGVAAPRPLPLFSLLSVPRRISTHTPLPLLHSIASFLPPCDAAQTMGAAVCPLRGGAGCIRLTPGGPLLLPRPLPPMGGHAAMERSTSRYGDLTACKARMDQSPSNLGQGQGLQWHLRLGPRRQAATAHAAPRRTTRRCGVSSATPRCAPRRASRRGWVWTRRARRRPPCTLGPSICRPVWHCAP